MNIPMIRAPTEDEISPKFLDRLPSFRYPISPSLPAEKRDVLQTWATHEWSMILGNIYEPRCKYFHEEVGDLFYCHDCQEYMCGDCFDTELDDHEHHSGFIVVKNDD